MDMNPWFKYLIIGLLIVLIFRLIKGITMTLIKIVLVALLAGALLIGVALYKKRGVTRSSKAEVKEIHQTAPPLSARL